MDVVACKECGMKVDDIRKTFDISTYTLYKILHLNNKSPTLSQATEGRVSVEGAEHRKLSPNNNIFHERPASTWIYDSDRHVKVKYTCLNCRREFYVRNRGSRTKFCSKKCQGFYKTRTNSVIKVCDYCGEEFRIKNSQSNNVIHCENCRGKSLGCITSKKSRLLGKYLNKHFNVSKEKSFSWFYDKRKPRGRFRLDYFLDDYNVGIEYDGEQHFKPCFTNKWESVDRVQERDRLKEKLCRSHEIKVIRFKYDEPLTEKYVLMKIYAEL